MKDAFISKFQYDNPLADLLLSIYSFTMNLTDQLINLISSIQWIQAVMAVTGGLAFYLSQQPNNKLRRYACIAGLIGQPFWLYSTFMLQQWGMFAATLFYTYGCLLGLKNYWIPCKEKIVYKSHNILHSIVWVK